MIIDSQNYYIKNFTKDKSSNIEMKDTSTKASLKDLNLNLVYTNKSILTNQIDFLTLNNNNKISSILNIYFDNEKDSIQNAKEYLDEIYLNLLKEEKELNNIYGYMEKQPDINEQMRAILIDWLIEVHLRFHLKYQTLYITVGIIDIYLSNKIIQRSKLQLLGITALLIACKTQEIYYPPIKDFIDIGSNLLLKFPFASDILDLRLFIQSNQDFCRRYD